MFQFKTAQDMKTAILNGPDSHEQWDEDEESQYDTTMLMRDIARSGMSQAVAKAIAELPEFGRFAKMLDLGGAHGLDGMATVQMYPSTEGIVFDRAAAGFARVDIRPHHALLVECMTWLWGERRRWKGHRS